VIDQGTLKTLSAYVERNFTDKKEADGRIWELRQEISKLKLTIYNLQTELKEKKALAPDLSPEAKHDLKKLISSGLTQGRSVDQIVEEVKDYFRK
jgi:hypothetical protein